MTKLLVIRPQPGATETVARAIALDLDALAIPLFAVVPLAWAAPDPDSFDALLMTSANAARHGGEALRGFSALPCYAVGEATAAAAREAGFRSVTAGKGDGHEALTMAARDSRRRLLHLCGRDHQPIEQPGLAVERRQVYAVEPVSALPGHAVELLRNGAAALLHSPRAAAHFAALVDQAGLDRSAIGLIAISAAAMGTAGEGWRAQWVAAVPRDEALLELAAKLCQTEAISDGTG